ncbi:Peptidase A1 domain-containing protein [Mycena venus]|uniref:Peptidase A1 domain-containing protein n=1 Tax=Mycena venus TaxID=2733690 RepID=A0A8H7CWG8_9AGAR|nr:Peptidase A1 domain-containing protein [Mycena venus]
MEKNTGVLRWSYGEKNCTAGRILRLELGSADAYFTINELDEKYAERIQNINVASVPPFPGDNGRWSVLVDRINVNGVDLVLESAVPNAPVGNGDMTFIILCSTSTIVTVVIERFGYIIHPLDLSDIKTSIPDDNGNNITACVSTIASLPASDSDALVRDTFMRNIYSVFNFGNAVAKSPTGSASIQMIPVLDAHSAVEDVQRVHMTQLANMAPDLLTIPGSVQGPNGALADEADALESSSGTDGEDGSAQKYALIIIGLLSGNLAVVLLPLVISVLMYIKRSGRSASGAIPKYVPVKLKDEEPVSKWEGDDERRYSD